MLIIIVAAVLTHNKLKNKLSMYMMNKILVINYAYAVTYIYIKWLVNGKHKSYEWEGNTIKNGTGAGTLATTVATA